MIDSFEAKARALYKLQCIIDREGDDGGKRRTQEYLDTLVAEELRNATAECITARIYTERGEFMEFLILDIYDTCDLLEDLSDDEKGIILFALLKYFGTQEELDLDGVAKTAFKALRRQVEKNSENHSLIWTGS
jgi:hypothetical protein